MRDKLDLRPRLSGFASPVARTGLNHHRPRVGAWVLAAMAWLLPSLAHAASAKSASPVGDLVTNLKQKALQEAVSTLLDHQLPLKLDASTLYPAVSTLPGDGPFNPMRFRVTAENWDHPLPPGDYVVQAVAFCSEYSVHRSGAGVAYQVGPIQGYCRNRELYLLNVLFF